MNLDEYQKSIIKFDTSVESDNLTSAGFIEKILGLTGEAGETADKVKKIIRDKKGEATEEDRAAIIKELGDVLWYVASISRYLGVPLSEVAKKNIDKLEDRYQRNTIHGQGDER